MSDSWLRKGVPLAVASLVGAGIGYLYYHYVGCLGGSCPITSQPLPSTLYGALLGALVKTSFTKK